MSAVADARERELLDALFKIAWLRPAGDICGIKLKDAIRLIEEIETIALNAIGEGL